MEGLEDGEERLAADEEDGGGGVHCAEADEWSLWGGTYNELDLMYRAGQQRGRRGLGRARILYTPY